MLTKMLAEGTWHEAVAYGSLPLDRGVAVLVDGVPIALFRVACEGRTDRVYAVDHKDPGTGAPVIARGIVGSVAETDIVASPIYKERYDLATGICLDNAKMTLATYPCRYDSGTVFVQTRRVQTTPPQTQH